ncbi:hypothetical protein FJQ98_07385 [Lysinibacillus agricola]|uniref:Uncharacterized protein n=1 Tax=Lysinibacillus agricola TaxID=2590012 RepID=A0ABX7AV70_9BACI|nr:MULTISPECIES: hypothetical protein [Lysinibacillus]KOS62885.1 hypothetical protein AN161_11285 [Lysinibacillus sp. FJAT-14222]QQP13853.1 hypothetical protein FJQ98_07385 [Lysinibacillus agricola]
MKKIITILFATLFISLTAFESNSYASEIDATSYSQKKEVIMANDFSNASNSQIITNLSFYKKQILNLTDEEFDRFMFNVVKDNQNNLDEVKTNLELVGVTLNIDNKGADVGIEPAAIKPSQMTLTAYSTKKSGDSFWRLNTSWTTNGVSEVYASTIDVVSIEWNANDGTYYDAAVPGSPVSKRDGSKSSSGVYLFNVEDDKLNFDSYATVYINKKTNNALSYGTKYIHTYSTVSTTVGGSASVNYEKGNITGGLSFDVSISTNQQKWSVWDDNVLYW